MSSSEQVNDNASAGGDGPHVGNDDRTRSQSAGSSAMSRVINHMSGNKIEALLWLTRIITVLSTFAFFLPVFGGNPYSYYQKVLLSNAVTSALRLHQRVPNFQFSREYLGRLFLEDSAHYLFYSLIFVTGPPVSMALLPVFLYAVLHAQRYTKQLLDQVGPTSVALVRRLLLTVEQRQVSILRFIACNEIFLMPSFVFLILTGQSNILTPFLYYRFLSLRYASQRNPYCKQLFYEIRCAVETLCSRPQCPQFLSGICYKAIGLISRLAPTAAAN